MCLFVKDGVRFSHANKGFYVYKVVDRTGKPDVFRSVHRLHMYTLGAEYEIPIAWMRASAEFAQAEGAEVKSLTGGVFHAYLTLETAKQHCFTRSAMAILKFWVPKGTEFIRGIGTSHDEIGVRRFVCKKEIGP